MTKYQYCDLNNTLIRCFKETHILSNYLHRYKKYIIHVTYMCLYCIKIALIVNTWSLYKTEILQVTFNHWIPISGNTHSDKHYLKWRIIRVGPHEVWNMKSSWSIKCLTTANKSLSYHGKIKRFMPIENDLLGFYECLLFYYLF